MASRKSAMRAVLRSCRLLGPKTLPSPPASVPMWGRGYLLEARGLHPLLGLVTPHCLHKPLTGLPRPLGPNVRRLLRSGDAESISAVLDQSEDAARFLRDQSTIGTCTSSSEEQGVRIDCVSGYVASASQPSGGKGNKPQYVFAYNMRFTNTGDRRWRLLARQYDFQDASQEVKQQIKSDHPHAAGVVGFTPALSPGESFEFGSGTALETPTGVVTGQFLMMDEPELEGEDADFHQKMEEAELNVRVAYLRGLETRQFHVPLGRLAFDASVPCIDFGPAA